MEDCDMKKNTFGDELIESMQEAVQIQRGRHAAKKTKDTVTVRPYIEFKPSEIKTIRGKAGMSASIFAKVLGVSIGTVQAWERGFRHPSGASARLLQIISTDPKTLKYLVTYNKKEMTF
jgi:putative transcriptional regulator